VIEVAICRYCHQTLAAPAGHDPLRKHADYCEPWIAADVAREESGACAWCGCSPAAPLDVYCADCRSAVTRADSIPGAGSDR
jgi:hypothetical protein